MRVLFATTANAGHFGPMVPFARACVAAGHEGLTRILRDDSYRTAAWRLAAEIADLPPVSGSADVLVRAALDG
jgi:hypothetical protein